MAYKEPQTKADLLNSMLSIDFSGDLRDLDPERRLQIKRLRRNAISLTFGSGNSFELVVRKPRGEMTGQAKATLRTRLAKARGAKEAVESNGSPPKGKNKGSRRQQPAADQHQ